MNNSTNTIPVTFWLIAGIALLWNLMGGFAFYTDITMTPELLATLPSDQQEMYANNPMWMKVLYGIATIGGIIASIGLLMRKSWAEKLFLISLVAVVIQMTYALFGLNKAGLTTEKVMFPLMIILIALFLWYYAKKAAARGWIS